MAQPNIVNVATIRGNTAIANATNVMTSIVTNSASSGSVYKVNALYISNIDSSNTANISVSIFRSNFDYYIANSVSIPVQSTLDVISKAIYLQENDSLRIAASANNRLQAVCSYEDIS
jgi:hypothetical protein